MQVCGKLTHKLLQVLVEMHERAPLQINLPFGVDARQGRARHVDAEQRLILELPYKSYRSCTQVCSLCCLIAAKCLHPLFCKQRRRRHQDNTVIHAVIMPANLLHDIVQCSAPLPVRRCSPNG